MHAQRYRLGYRSDIEGLRAVAILLVVAVHAHMPWFGGGFIGVDVFFVLSGYLITGLLVQELDATGRVGFAAFYARRFRRLLPALLTMVLLTSAAAAVLLAPGEQADQARAAASATLWLSNFHFAFSKLYYFGPSAESNLFLHTWSLGVEEQFYLLWPALLVLVLGAWHGQSVPLRMRRLKIAMLAIAGVSLLACVVLTRTSPQLAFYLMPTRAWQFALGALVLLHFRTPGGDSDGHALSPTQPVSRWSRPAIQWAGWLGLGAILAAALLFDANMPYPGIPALLPSLGAAALLAAGSQATDTGAARVLSWRPLQAIGRVSYSWYLWHWPVLLLGGTLVTMASPVHRIGLVVFSFVLAVLSYRLIEAPIRRNARLVKRPGVLVLAALALMITANVLCIRWFDAVSDWMSQPQQKRYLVARYDLPVIYAMGCDDWFHSAGVRICAFGAKDARHTAVLMGDSVGAQWFPAVAGVFDKPGWRLLVLTKSSCPMVDEPLFYPRIGREYVECAAWRRSALQALTVLKPDVVILGSTSTYGFSKKQWLDGTARVLNVISSSAGHIYLLRATPEMPFDGPACLADRSWLPGFLARQNPCHAPAFSQQNTNVYGWLQQVAHRYGNVTTIDMDDLVCPGGECDAERQGMVVFRDTQHLTATFVQSLTPALADRLQASEAQRRPAR